MRYRIVRAGAALLAVCGALLLAPAGANATPAYAEREKKECVYCHVQPGQARNFRGLYYAANRYSFAQFDEAFEARMAGVKPNSMAFDARPTNPAYPRYTVAPLLNFRMKDIDGKMVHLGRYQGDVILIVNVASFCGYTPQYAGLQKLYQQYKDRGFVVLGFPANEFGAQEPGSDKQIKEFCTSKYDVTFPIFSKIVVKGEGQHPLYRYLTDKATNPQFAGEIEWNFTKFLVNRKGEVVERFRSNVEPLNPRLTSLIERELDRPRPK